MNKRRLGNIIRKIKANPDCWVQEMWHTDCGTAHCIAGHAEIAALRAQGSRARLTSDNSGEQCEEIAALWLDLGPCQANYLFCPNQTLSAIEQFYESGGKIPDKWTPCISGVTDPRDIEALK
jgi:hypothetical protein